MEIIKITKQQTAKNAIALKERGYISRNTYTDKKYREKYNIPEQKVLYAMAENCTDISTIKVITDGTATYWFKRDMIENLWLEPIVPVPTKEDIRFIDSIKKAEKCSVDKTKGQELPLTFTVKIDEKHLEEVKNKYIQEIESKTNELFDLTQRINKEQRDNITIFCPFTLSSIQTIWMDCIDTIRRASKLNITVKFAEKKEKLDAMKPCDSNWENKLTDINYSIGSIE
jgi:ribosomal protein L25 (general stress protein Ctc)